MRPSEITTLIHFVGFTTGAVLYAMLGVMAVRGRPAGRRRAVVAGVAPDRMALATAVLGVVWNAGGLLLYGVRDLGLGTPPGWTVALAFAALGFLPAVVVHAAAQNLPPGPRVRLLTATAYGVSALAAVVQFATLALGGTSPSRAALLLLSAGYIALMVALAALLRRQPGWRRGLSAVALAAFAVMALHLSQHDAAPDEWWLVLVGHHASIPLALAILYQDYRFALADLFLKRVLELLALVAASIAAYLGLIVPFVVPRLVRDPLDPRAVAALLAVWLAVAASYPGLRRAVGRFVDRVVLRRADYRQVSADIAGAIAALDTEAEVLERSGSLLARALWAEHVSWRAAAGRSQPGLSAASVVLRDGRQQATVAIPTTDAPAYDLEVGSLAGGRILLSDDLRLIETAAALTGHRVDSIRLTRERLERRLRESEMLQLATDAELRALRAQLNPHFLFNALNTIAYLMRAAPARAQDTLYRLTDLLRAVLRRSEGVCVTLGQELEIVEAYLAIEQARFGERLTFRIDVPEELRPLPVPPLLLQPLVENSVKHGLTPRAQGGSITVSATIQSAKDEPGDVLRLIVSDTGVGLSPPGTRAAGSGIGLSSVRRRLQRQYGTRGRIDVRGAAGAGTTVEILLPIASIGAPGAAALQNAGG